MTTDYTKRLLIGIFIVGLLLCVCVSVDYADDNITVTANQSQVNVSNCTLVNGVHYDNVIVNRSKGHIENYNVVSVKPHYPIITMTGKPSCSRCARNHIPYRWFTRSYVNYCPNCHRYGTLGNKHKYGSRYEQEITCFHCDSDFCVYDGHEKYSWSNKYLRRA